MQNSHHNGFLITLYFLIVTENHPLFGETCSHFQFSEYRKVRRGGKILPLYIKFTTANLRLIYLNFMSEFVTPFNVLEEKLSNSMFEIG